MSGLDLSTLVVLLLVIATLLAAGWMRSAQVSLRRKRQMAELHLVRRWAIGAPIADEDRHPPLPDRQP